MSKEDQRGGERRALNKKDLHKKGFKRIEKKLQIKRSNKDYRKINEHGNKKGSAQNNKYITVLRGGNITEKPQGEENKRGKIIKFSPQRNQEDGDKKDKGGK